MKPKRKEALEAAKPQERNIEQCAHCDTVGEMNFHVTDQEDGKDAVIQTFCDSACYNAHEKELGHIETP